MQADFDKYSKLHPATLNRRFGSWQSALERANLGHLFRKHHWRSMSDDDLLGELRRVAALIEAPVLTTDEFSKHSEVSVGVFKGRFGGWRKALARAGLEQMDYRLAIAPLFIGYPDDVLIEEIRRVAGIVDKPTLTHDDFNKHSRIYSTTVARRFGGWRAGLERAGVGHRYSADKRIPG